jgi:beta-lactamase class D
MILRRIAFACMATGLAVSAAQARTVCTAIADATTGKLLLQQGDCGSRVTPASTFKIALGLMGYDSGFLKDEHSPTLPYRNGYADWGGAAWRQPTDPTRWIKYSVVWFSQQITHTLGEDRLHRYAVDFGYGNADFSGDLGRNNGLDRSWIDSSLKISPLEEVTFLVKLVNRQLPVAQHAFDMTTRITEVAQLPSGWNVHGKTGTAYPRYADGTFDAARGHGWFVGWATKSGHTVTFARLIQDETKQADSAGVRARDSFLAELPALVEPAVR